MASTKLPQLILRAPLLEENKFIAAYLKAQGWLRTEGGKDFVHPLVPVLFLNTANPDALITGQSVMSQMFAAVKSLQSTEQAAENNATAANAVAVIRAYRAVQDAFEIAEQRTLLMAKLMAAVWKSWADHKAGTITFGQSSGGMTGKALWENGFRSDWTRLTAGSDFGGYAGTVFGEYKYIDRAGLKVAAAVFGDVGATFYQPLEFTTKDDFSTVVQIKSALDGAPDVSVVAAEVDNDDW